MENLEKLINEKFNTVNSKLDNIEKRLDKINGSVQRHEKQIGEALIERAANREQQKTESIQQKEMEKRLSLVEKDEINHLTNCPQASKVRILEDESLSNKSVKRFMGAMFAGGVAIGGVIIGIIELILK